MKTIKMTKGTRDKETGEFLFTGKEYEKSNKRADDFINAGRAEGVKKSKSKKDDK